ncbi:MAG: lactate racemase domain-containing protein [Anaerovoracaceae bacterium]|jgi:hypothetical protein
MKETKMDILPQSAYEIKLPQMVTVEQSFADDCLEDIAARIKEQFAEKKDQLGIKAGARTAVLVGSRGISNLALIVRSVIDGLKAAGSEPFIVPAMGSHGGGKAEEQQRIIEAYGVTGEAMGVPVVSSMETVQLGTTPEGVPVFFDANAAAADAIVPVGRIKVHTGFKGPIESGLCKMLAIGGGKHNGCARLHHEGFEKFPRLIPAAAKVIIDELPVIFGAAIIENAHEHTWDVELVPAGKILQREPELLRQSIALMPRIKFDDIDVLVIERIGKEISGCGMDPNITGRMGDGPIEDFNGPRIKRILVEGLSPASHGNAIGIGLADFVTRDALEGIDYEVTYTNCIASGDLNAGKIPIVVSDEEEGLRAAIQNCHGIDFNDARIVKIKDTLHLEKIQVSRNML